MVLDFPIRSNKLRMTVLANERLARKQSIYQVIDVYNTPVFGRILMLDGHIQLTEMDEAAYHEALIHVPGLSIPNIQTALVVGGGDGGCVRELLKYPSLKRVDMVEIDPDVIEISKKYLPFVCGEAFENPRLNLKIMDAFEFVSKSENQYDLIIVDATDVYEEEDGCLSERLFTQTFYADCLRLLTDDGFLVTQADNLVFCPYSLEGLKTAFKEVFPKLSSYHAIVPSFGGFSGFIWGSKGNEPKKTLPSSAMSLSYLNPDTYAFGFTRLPFEVSY